MEAMPAMNAFEQLALTAANRPALPRFDYAADDAAAVAARLRSRLPQALPGWNAALAEAGGDYATLLIDLYAHLAGTLLAYADQRANEAYLRSATLPRSLIDLAALVDERIGDGASASALQAFFAKPGAGGTLASGFRVTARVDGVEQVFETGSALAVHASRNQMRVDGWDRSARSLRLGASAGAVQDLQAELDAAYPGLKAGLPLVFETPTTLAALPLAAAEPAASASLLRWSAGSAAAAAELAIAELTILGRPKQLMRLAQAERADEIALGSHALPVANAAMFTVGSAVLVDSAGLLMPALVLAKSVTGPGPAGSVTLQRGMVAALRRSATRVLEGRSCGATTLSIRVGSTQLLRQPLAKKKDFPHTPAPGDLLLIADASGVELATVASAAGALINLAQPLLRALRPVSTAFDTTPRVRYYSVAPADPASHQTTVRPLLLGELSGVLVGGNTRLTLDKSYDGLTPGTVVALFDGTRTLALRLLEAANVDGKTTLLLTGSAPPQLRVALLQLAAPFEHHMHVAGWNRSEARLAAGASQLVLVGQPQGLAAGQDLVIADSQAAEGARIAQLELLVGPPARSRVSLASPLQHSYALADLLVHGNVAAMTHGASAADEVLGSGTGSATPLRLALRRSPLAWLPDPAADKGVAPALQLLVAGQLWRPVSTLADSGPLDHHYALEIDERERAQVVFGDGQHGAVPPSGRNNIVVRYRAGHGTAANVAAGALTSMPTPAAFVASSRNPLPASGGADRDTPERSRTALRHRVRTLQRAVTLDDHAELAMAYAGVARARADWQREGQGAGARRLIMLTVAAEGGKTLSTPQQEALLAWLAARSVLPLALRVRSHRAWPVRCALQVTLLADRERAAMLRSLQSALGAGVDSGGRPGFFAFDRRGLGEPLHLSALYACVEAVAGVDHVLATAFHAETEAAAVLDRIDVPADAQASGGDAADLGVGRLSLALVGGLL